MVHTRHSFRKDTLEDFSNLNGHGNITEEEGNAKINGSGKNINEEVEQEDEGDDGEDVKNAVDEDQEEDNEDKETKVENERKPKKRRRTMLDLYDSLSYHDTFQRRSLRTISREKNKRYMGHYEGGSRRKSQNSYGLGSSLIRRSDRQKKKVFDTFNESEIQREIERKHKEMMEAASMYDAIKRRRGEHSDTQDDDEEDSGEETDEDGEEEDGVEESEAHKSYSLRTTRQKTNLYQAPLPSRRGRRQDVLFSMQSPMRKSRRQRIPQHSPHHRSFKRRRRASSTSSSDDEAAFERRKSKSMSQARSRCLPMNFQTDDIVGILKNRERARESGLAGASLADIEPMTIDSTTSFQDVGGLDHHIRALKEMVVFPLLYPEVFQKFGISPPRGVLFYGPPGTGKTLVARALANECGQKGQKVAFFMRKGADCLSKWVGESERQLRLLFDQAYTMRPSIIFFDEIDGIAPVRSTRQDQIHSSIVSTLLALMDGLDARGEIVIIGATNRLDSIDPALRRPGRFDRELLFNLPNRKARQKIIELHTSSWQPKLSREFMLELADKCVGYCGADIKALCTEAALFALRRRYPQIYKSNKKYALDMNEIKISAVDFKNALKSVTPASNRSGAAPGVALPESLKPLLSEYVEKAFEILMKVFPAGEKITDYDPQDLLESSDDEDMNIYEKPRSRSRGTNDCGDVFKIKQNVVKECLTHRPRMLFHGESGNGQTSYVAPSLLYAMEHLTTHVMDLPVLFGSSTRTAEEAVSQVFREAKRTSPSIIYLPHIVTWWNSVSETTRATFMTLLQDIQPSVPVLFLATSEVKFDDIPESIQDLFSTSREELFEVNFPTSLQRCEYFKDIFLDHALRVPTVQRKGSRKHFVEILQEASPPKPRELSQEECKKLIESEETTLRELRLFLRNITWKLLADRKFKEFSKPVDLEEVDDYLKVIKEPMDLSTVMTRINAHHYYSCEHFLKDIDLITNNCLEYNPDKDQYDKLLRNRVCEMRDVAHALVHNDLDPEFDKMCLEVHERRQQRGDTTTFAPSFLKVLPSHGKKPGQNDTEPSISSSSRPMANIPDPTGPRYSRRVRGISEGVMYDASVLDLVESTRRRSTKPPTKPQDAAGEETVDSEDKLLETSKLPAECSVDESSQDTLMSVDNTDRDTEHTESTSHDDEQTGRDGKHMGENNEFCNEPCKETDTNIDRVKRSLEFQGADTLHKEISEKEEAELVLSKLVDVTTGCSVQDLERIFAGLCRRISDHKNEQDRFVVLKEMHEFIDSLGLTSALT